MLASILPQKCTVWKSLLNDHEPSAVTRALHMQVRRKISAARAASRVRSMASCLHFGGSSVPKLMHTEVEI